MQLEMSGSEKSEREPQGPEEFRLNKWITYLKSHLKNLYTCRLAQLISLVGSLRYRKRFLRFWPTSTFGFRHFENQ